MLVKIGPRILDEADIECIHTSNYRDYNGHLNGSVTVVMKNGNQYKHAAKETILSSDTSPIDEIYNNIKRQLKGE